MIRVDSGKSTGRTFAAAVWCMAFSAAAWAASFRFTATADSRSLRTDFQHVLSEITAQVGGEGVFHVSCGDIDPAADNYADLVAEFGSGVVWYPVVGNHEVDNPPANPDIEWIRNDYPSLPYVVNPGPTGCGTTTYSFEYGNAHFVVLNEYYDGASETGTDGDVVDALYDWLVADLDANAKPAVFVFGHEPAYPQYRHVGGSLDGYPANRDRFWKLLNDRKVMAYFCGHTHYYYRKQVGDSGSSLSWTAFTWQIDLGNAGNDTGGDGLTFVDVTVGDEEARFDVWRGISGPFSLAETWSVQLAGGVPSDGRSGSHCGCTSGGTAPDGGMLAAIVLALGTTLALWRRRECR